MPDTLVKVLLDACVWGGAMPVLRSEGHDAEWVGDWSADRDRRGATRTYPPTGRHAPMTIGGIII